MQNIYITIFINYFKIYFKKYLINIKRTYKKLYIQALLFKNNILQNYLLINTSIFQKINLIDKFS